MGISKQTRFALLVVALAACSGLLLLSMRTEFGSILPVPSRFTHKREEGVVKVSQSAVQLSQPRQKDSNRECVDFEKQDAELKQQSEAVRRIQGEISGGDYSSQTIAALNEAIAQLSAITTNYVRCIESKEE